ncbi:hypothetical protein MKX01_019883, partial [Papaver californicum]
MDLRKSPRLLSSSTSVPIKRPVENLKPTSVPTTTTEKSYVEAEKSKKKNDENAGVVYEKDCRRVWTEEDEIGLLKYTADFVVK